LDDRALDGARIRAGDTVADIGGGTGLRTQSVVERVGPDGDVLALEMSVDVLEQLRANMSAPNVSYLIGRADVLPLMDASVDALVASSAIDVEDRAEAASEFLRVLRNGGRVSMLEREQDASWEQLLTSAGFSDVRTDPAAPYLTAVKP
jgi:arsenite methyltransferase